MPATLDRTQFAPPPPPGMLRAIALAVLAHLLLMAALTWGISWNSDPVTLSAEAELWSRTPQEAAARPVEPMPPPPPQPAPTPVPPPPPVEAVKAPAPPEPSPAARDAEIALEREKEKDRLAAERRKQLALEKKREEQKERERELAAQKKREAAEELAAQKKREAAQELAAKRKQDEARKKQELAKARAAEEKKEKEEAVKKQQLAEEAKRTETQRQANLERMKGLAGATGAPTATGTALRSSGPSSSYAGRIVARVRPNIVFGEDIEGNPRAEVEVKTAPDGTIVGQRIVKSSGVKSWDEAVLKALIKTEILPRDTDGRVPPSLIIEFRPKN